MCVRKRRDREQREHSEADRRRPVRARLRVVPSVVDEHGEDGDGDRNLHGRMDERGAEPVAAMLAGEPDEAHPPEHGACDRDGAEPRPASHRGQHAGRCGDHGDKQHDRPRIGRLRRDEERGEISARHAEAGDRRSVEDRAEQGGDADRTEEDERRALADELVKRVSRVDRAERDRGAGSRQDARHVGRPEPAGGWHQDAPPEHLAEAEQAARKEAAEGHAHGRRQEARFD